MNRAGIVAIALFSSAAHAPASAFLVAPASASFSHRPPSQFLTLRKKGFMGVLGGGMAAGRRVGVVTMQVTVPIRSKVMRARVDSSFPNTERCSISLRLEER